MECAFGGGPRQSAGEVGALKRSRLLSLFRERPYLLGEAALVARGLVAVNDALIHHAVDDRGCFGERAGGFRMLAGLERQGRLPDGAAQLRGERVVAGAMRRRLSGSFFSRFRIRQARDSSKRAA